MKTVGWKCTKVIAGVHVIANVTLRHGVKIYSDLTKAQQSKLSSRKKLNNGYPNKEETLINSLFLSIAFNVLKTLVQGNTNPRRI